MKRVLLSVIISATSVFAMAQTQNVTHVVQRGETIESIAKYYHVSIDDINKANPNTDGLIYVGMKLIVPQISPISNLRPITQGQNNSKTNSTTIVQTDITRVSEKKTNNESLLNFKIFTGVTVGQWIGKDFKENKIDESFINCEAKNKSSFGFHIGANADYLFSENFYAGIGLIFNQTGYKKEIDNNSGKYWDDEGANYESEVTIKMTTNKFDVPLHIGGTFVVAPNSHFFLEAGPMLSYTINGKKKTTGYMTTHDDIHSEETEHYNDKVKIGKRDLKDYQKFGYGLSATAGISYNNILLQFTYQRGLSKTIKKTKQYEQNFLLSIGYIL